MWTEKSQRQQKKDNMIMKTGLQALAALQHFIGPAQRHAVISAMRGEERQWFADKLAELAGIVETMPKTGETDGQGDAAIAYLHYFAGGQANWYIRERDKGSRTDAPEDQGKQLQAFGLADLFNDGGELGYVSIQEILECGGELDFHWRPKPMAEVRARQRVAA